MISLLHRLLTCLYLHIAGFKGVVIPYIIFHSYSLFFNRYSGLITLKESLPIFSSLCSIIGRKTRPSSSTWLLTTEFLVANETSSGIVSGRQGSLKIIGTVSSLSVWNSSLYCE